MAKTIRTCDGDILDVICRIHYGHLAGTVEAV
ncbi:tail protein X, partial [Laribacter hongkongensis]|nr:tail protein X [Laribacter hongkongensis]MCG9015194.1 tail protein X [Laribacter hongkongensis]